MRVSDGEVNKETTFWGIKGLIPSLGGEILEYLEYTKFVWKGDLCARQR